MYQEPIGFYAVVMFAHDLEYHWAMLDAYGNLYWHNGISSKEPDDYIQENNLNKPFVWEDDDDIN